MIADPFFNGYTRVLLKKLNSPPLKLSFKINEHEMVLGISVNESTCCV